MEKIDLSQAEKIDIAVGNGCFVALYSSVFFSIDLVQLQDSDCLKTL